MARTGAAARLARWYESELRGFVFELAMVLQTWTGHPKELTTACELFGVNLKTVEAKARKTLAEAERTEKPEEAWT